MESILLVDNDPQLLELLTIGLEDFGFGVTSAASGLEALRLLGNRKFDVLVTDLIMPNINGEKLLRIVASNDEWSRMKTIVVSGVAAEAPELKATLECDIYIAKGPLRNMLQYIRDAIQHFDRIRKMSTVGAIGVEDIYSRHITRELLDYKNDTDIVLEHVGDGICKFDREFSIVWINRAFCSLAGDREETLLGSSILELMEPQSRARFSEAFATVRSASEEFDVRLVSGRSIRVRPMYSFQIGIDHSVVMWTDVTQRLLSDRQFENIVESSNDIIWTYDFDGRFTYVSGSVRRLTGWTPEEVVGKPMWEFLDGGPTHLTGERFRRTMEIMKKRPPRLPSALNVRYFRKDGTPRWGEVRSGPLHDHAGNVIGVRGVIADITERIHAEKERERLIAEQSALVHELHHRVNENLQLISSLAKIGQPASLESRLFAMGEVFGSLYTSDSFADVPIETVLRQIIANTIDGAESRFPITSVVKTEIATLHIRWAVPIALLASEAVARAVSDCGTFSSAVVETGIRASGAGELTLTVEITGEPTADGTALDETGHCPDQDELITILVSQLGGTESYRVDPERIRFSATVSVQSA